MFCPVMIYENSKEIRKFEIMNKFKIVKNQKSIISPGGSPNSSFIEIPSDLSSSSTGL